ncbi:MAG: isopentenyl-diphosphate Delta-isomerase [Synergistaceae bacterium]|jgi:isopentenyl-diphosphate delta-isomerase|nr:isopentenyl-diphosphate Delta-isomerase [Synergistaceae bacterium]
MKKIILVDVFDRPIGAMEKMEAHASPKLHRAFSVFLFHNGKMLLQQRAAHKYHSGGLWANACCSHPVEEEETEGAVLRRLEEELGVGDVAPKELFSFVYMHKFRENLYEYEYDHVYAADWSGALSVDKAEVAAVEWMEFEELARRLREIPEKFAPWFLIAAPCVLNNIS